MSVRKFTILKPVFMSFIFDNDQHDYVIDPKPDVLVEFDGTRLYLVNSRGRHPSITENHAVEGWLAEGLIKELDA